MTTVSAGRVTPTIGKTYVSAVSYTFRLNERMSTWPLVRLQNICFVNRYGSQEMLRGAPAYSPSPNLYTRLRFGPVPADINTFEPRIPLIFTESIMYFSYLNKVEQWENR